MACQRPGPMRRPIHPHRGLHAGIWRCSDHHISWLGLAPDSEHQRTLCLLPVLYYRSIQLLTSDRELWNLRFGARMVGKRVLLQDSPFSRFINHEAQLPQQHTLPLVQSCLLVQELGVHMCVCVCVCVCAWEGETRGERAGAGSVLGEGPWMHSNTSSQWPSNSSCCPNSSFLPSLHVWRTYRQQVTISAMPMISSSPPPAAAITTVMSWYARGRKERDPLRDSNLAKNIHVNTVLMQVD